ncbi:hypothetical protein HY570_03865 [Candidatus Micrarchaeota archaeon]|nr:hypothetical protein [Candidatus Micrarchaeota archaeon]
MGLLKHKSRSLARVQRRTVSGKTVTHYRARKNDYMKCGICKSNLLSVTNSSSVSKSSKRPSRIFGGHLCHGCTRTIISQASKIKAGTIKINDVDILLQPYVKTIAKV